MRRRMRILILFAAVVASSFGNGCRQDAAPASRPSGDLRIVCTFLPVYVFTLNVVGDAPGVRVEMLVSRGVGCPHHYSMRPADLKRASQADLIIANGLGIEPFLDDLVRGNSTARVLTLSDDCDVLKEASAGHAEPEHAGANPHVWVSPVEVVKEVRTLARKLGQADPPRADRYKANGEAFVARLESLHRQMLDAAKGFTKRDIVTFHDAFAYLARDLGLNVVATLEAEPGQEPSAHQMATIIDILRRTRAPVFFEPASSDQIARTVARDAGVPVFAMNPFNSLDGEPTARSYEEVMSANLKVLRQALGDTR